MPQLVDVLFVDGLKANLLSISQLLCDLDYAVLFSKGNCKILDSNGQCLMEGTRINDNYYTIAPNSLSHQCQMTRPSETELWHWHMDHINYKDFRLYC